MRRQRGFTLMELVIVIALLGIMSTLSVQFIINMAQGYSAMARRQSMSSAVQLAVERLGRELRQALPGSIRIAASGGDRCIEFIPVIGASRYSRLPQGGATMDIVPLPANTTSGQLAPFYFAIVPPNGFAAAGIDPYSLSANSALAQLLDVAAYQATEGQSSLQTISLAGNHSYPANAGVSQRFYITTAPVSFCLLADGDLYRYRNYQQGSGAFVLSQPVPPLTPAGDGMTEPDRTLLANGLSAATGAPFVSLAPLVLFDLQVVDQGETVRLQHLVEVRNR